ncbi:MAG TPA: hypothetical protein VGD22_07075 [Sphingobacteriaceae bacterium]
MEKIKRINEVVKNYFNHNPLQEIIPAKDLMPQFIKAGIFEKDAKNGLPIRKVLRQLDKDRQLHHIPQVVAMRKAVNTNWFFSRNAGSVTPALPRNSQTAIRSQTKSPKTPASDSDEKYVLDLCDKILNKPALRQHRFDFLRGDSGTKLPVDAYYPDLNLVIEYRETQHTNAVKHFDKPDIMTVSGVHRGEQRKIYDQRRRDVLPKNGIQLIEISYTDFELDRRNRIIRDRERDSGLVKSKLENSIIIPKTNYDA